MLSFKRKGSLVVDAQLTESFKARVPQGNVTRPQPFLRLACHKNLFLKKGAHKFGYLYCFQLQVRHFQ
jgi:hypothetical protein